MQNNNPTLQLQQQIKQRESEQVQKLAALKLQFHETYDSFKPVNILKNTLVDIKNTPEIKQNITSTILGITGGFVMNKLVSITGSNPVTKIIGTVLQYVVGNYITKHTQNDAAE